MHAAHSLVLHALRAKFARSCAASLCPSLPFDGLLLWSRFVKKKDAMTEMAEALGAHRAKEFNLGKNPNRLGEGLCVA